MPQITLVPVVFGDGIEGRRCNLCGSEKPYSEFHKRYGKARSYCKDCSRAYVTRNTVRANTQARRWRALHRDKCAAASRKWELKNQERVRASRRAWNEKNREKRRHYDLTNSARRRQIMGKDGVSAKQIRDRVAMFGGRCWVCFKPYEQIDHVKPLARGGRHIAANLRPICKACNIKKKAKWPFRREMVA